MSKFHYGWGPDRALPELGRHSVTKHEVFDQYVRVYIEKLTHHWSQEALNLTIVDGFCGGGAYQLGGNVVDGSPLRLLEAVTTAERALNASRKKGFRINVDFFFVDEKRDHVEFLRKILIDRGYGGRIGEDVHLYNQAFEAAYPVIRNRIRAKGTAHRSIFFLDQYGWSDVSLATVRDILSNLRNPEVLLTFSVDALIDYLRDDPALAVSLMKIELTREDVRELMAMKGQKGWRYLIQNTLYTHVQTRTGSRFYTPFFIHSAEAHRSYWLLHLSNHRQARDEMGKLHWRLQNSFSHHGGPGLHSLGFDPKCDLRQLPLDFAFDDDALSRSRAAVLEQLPRLIHSANRNHLDPPTVEELFSTNCNDTPVTSDIVKSKLLELRNEGEIEIIASSGAVKPRSVTICWDDRIQLPRERSMFSPLGW